MASELAIIGAGLMAEAIARGIVRSRLLQSGEIIAADISEARRKLFETELNITAVERASEAASQANIVLLCTKPQQVTAVLAEIAPVLDERTLIVSIAAGVSCGKMEAALGNSRRWRVVRAMPNTPMLVGDGMVAIAPGSAAGEADLRAARRLFESAASVVDVREEQMDAVTAVSGSGPAYFYFLVEQMIKAGVELGLSEAVAKQLATQTALGAARMLVSQPDAPSEHRRRVTTPNGTTHAAINHLESHNWPQITVDALKAAASRSREMGK